MYPQSSSNNNSNKKHAEKSASEHDSIRPVLPRLERFEPMATALSRAEARFDAAQKARKERLAGTRNKSEDNDDDDDVLIA